jgi:2-isopropylmalate synthase
MDIVRIFDTTLRDGEQSPGASMNLAEKLEVARALRDLGVDVIEAGFPAASPGDFEAVRAIARDVRGPAVAGLARCAAEDIARAWEALRESPRPRIHVFLATSAIHRQFKLRMAKEEIVRRAVEGVVRAKELCDDVEFSPEDASRTEPDFLAEVVGRVVAAGATTVNIPDTVGYAVPQQFGALIAGLAASVRGRATVSVHCHNDLGLAVANSLAAVAAGARQVECTINGIGERAGNCSLEEVVMALRTRADVFGARTGIRTERLHPTSRLVSTVTGLAVPRNKAVVGQNAFAHEAGIHQHGMLSNAATYEIMRPEDVGFPRTTLVLGKHSGRHAIRARARELGFTLDDAQLDRVFEDFKALADKKKEVYDADLEALIGGRLRTRPSPWELVSLSASAGTVPSAAVVLRREDGATARDGAVGNGPIDAVFKSIERITGVRVRLRDYQVRSVTVGEDAQGEVSLEAERDGVALRGRAAGTDIVEASARAFLNIVNRIDSEAAWTSSSTTRPSATEASARG